MSNPWRALSLMLEKPNECSSSGWCNVYPIWSRCT